MQLTVRNIHEKQSYVQTCGCVGVPYVRAVNVHEKQFSTLFPKDFHRHTNPVVDLLRPDFPSPDSPSGERASKKTAGMHPAVWMFHHKGQAANVWMFRRSAVSHRLLYFTSFKVIASTTEQLKISFRRCNTHFSTAEAIQERK